MPPNRIRRVISASDNQALQTAQTIMDTVRSAYLQQPGAMLIADGTLNPLELVVVDGQSGRYYRIPVTTNDDGTFNFGTPIPVTGPTPPGGVNPGQPGGTPSLASRGVPAHEQQRIAAAVARGAIPPGRVAFYEAKAARGEDISDLDTAWSPGPAAAADRTGMVAASASQEDQDDPEYSVLFGSVEQGQRVSDAREAAARAAAPQTAEQAFERMFGKGGPCR